MSDSLRAYRGSSFYRLLKAEHPELLPIQGVTVPEGAVPHGTTIVAIRCNEGVVIGGDRRATMNGHYIMNEHVVKVFQTDNHSAMAIAGVFGPSVKMAKLFQTELEHYEKIEGLSLTLEGKANRLSQMVEMNFPAAVQGLPVMPIFAGYDLDDHVGRIFEYDITGGTFVKPKQEPYSCSGSGGDRALSTFEHFYRDDLSREDACALIVKALDFASKKDAATGGKNYILKTISNDGVIELSQEEIQALQNQNA